MEILKTIGIPAAVWTILFFATKKYLENTIAASFDKKLEDHKHDLQIASEEAKFDFQRKIEDFNLFVTQKHEKYSELYGKLLEAFSRVTNLYGLKSELTYEEHNEADIRRIMEKENFPEGKIQEIFQIWEAKDKSEAIDQMKIFKRLVEFQKASRSIQEARSYFRPAQLYFSDDLVDLIEEFFSKLNHAQSNYEINHNFHTGMPHGYTDLVKEGREAENKAKDFLSEITSQMKKELSVGYY